MTEISEKGILMVISGPSGSGKGELVKLLLRSGKGFALSVSATTRAPRAGETDGVSYHFMTRDKFEGLLSEEEFLEYNEYNGNYYGTPKSEVSERIASGVNLILEIDVHGAMNIKKRFPEAVLVMIAPPDFQTLERRLRGRGDDVPEETIQKRLATARDELAMLGEYDYIVVNEDGKLDATADRILSIIAAERCRTLRNPGFAEKFYGND